MKTPASNKATTRTKNKAENPTRTKAEAREDAASTTRTHLGLGTSGVWGADDGHVTAEAVTAPQDTEDTATQ